MSLVAYDASSDEESDNETSVAVIVSTSATKVPQLPQPKDVIYHGHISDEDDEFIPHIEENEKELINSLSQILPKPKNDANLSEMFENFSKPSFSILPTPKSVDTHVDVEEVDDEFLRKKPNEEIIEKPIKDTDVIKMPVKIMIPSLKNFKDVEKEMAEKAKNRNVISHSTSSLSSGLLSILPKAKSEQNFAKIASTFNEDKRTSNATIAAKPALSRLVPDAVKHGRPATNTEDVDRLKPTKKKLCNQTNKTLIHSNKKFGSDESDCDDNDIGDFFSFNSDQSLPIVSSTEINDLVAKKVAKIAETTTNYLKASESQKSNEVEKLEVDTQELESSRKRYHQLNSDALQALVGGSTKRRRQKEADIQVIDINSSQVLPKKDEWMRTALASSTSYQPTGVLVDEEPASGTRRKHQITYLAHKAKANEAELQAMWSANRQNRRATQSKYGF